MIGARIVNSHIRFRSMGPFRLRCRCGSNRSVLRPTQTKIKIPKRGFLILVALVGLEPTLLAELDFESSASTNSATGPWHQKAFIMLLSLLQLFLPNVHCGLPCEQVFLQVQQVCQLSFQWLF